MWRLPMLETKLIILSFVIRVAAGVAFVPHTPGNPTTTYQEASTCAHSFSASTKLNNLIIDDGNMYSSRRQRSRASMAPTMLLVGAEHVADTLQRAGLVSTAGDSQNAAAVSLAAVPSWAGSMLMSGILDDMDPTKLGLFAFAGLGVAAAGFKTAVYWRMQYVVAALLTNRVPAVEGGAEVLELSAKDTKTLYYMPTGGVRRLTLSTVKDLQEEIVNGAATQARIPTALVRKQEGSKISCTSGTMDCVVSIYGFSGGVAAGTGDGSSGQGPATIRGLASEVARVLKPGGSLLLVEKGEAKALVDEVREALGSVQVNMVNNLADPYCVALGTKTKTTEDEALNAEASAGGASNRRSRRFKKKAEPS